MGLPLAPVADSIVLQKEPEWASCQRAVGPDRSFSVSVGSYLFGDV